MAYGGPATTARMTAVIEREDDMYVALCPELDIASQGESVELAKKNLQEAVTLFFETADAKEIERRLHNAPHLAPGL
ncbi:MAG TPA: type II toxin-antitoxin system HicB family antitoxin [Fimbriimonas sp.]|nr:type II toxin-antitoxin system HicB family antitoxin [Fimbriimonas sp.]